MEIRRPVAFGTCRGESIDPELAFVQAQSMDDFMNRSPAIFLRRYPFYLIGSFAVLALVLAASVCTA